MEGLWPSCGQFGCVIHDASASVVKDISSTPAPEGGNWRMHVLGISGPSDGSYPLVGMSQEGCDL